MILEGLVTTLNEDGRPNIAPMGPIVDAGLTRLTLRPFQSSLTFANLRRHGEGVFHVTDDVLLLARSAIGQLDEPPPMTPARAVQGVILTGACRWHAFQVESLDDSQPRASLECRVVESGTLRDFFGFNRAKHAVLEGAILATRVGILPAEEIRRQMAHLAVIVEKTGGPQERQAFDLLSRHIDAALR